MKKPDLTLYPNGPGVYFYKNHTGKIIYIGKARNLRQRLASYFRSSASLPIKTQLMLEHAEQLDFLSTATEKEALLLEASLIKKHRPRYNILLRDDKEYLLFCINEEEPYPRLEIIRRNTQKKSKQSKIFGPFSSGGAAKETWKFIHKQFPLRRCKDKIFKNRTRPCLYYYIGQCLAPCVFAVSTVIYQELIKKICLFLKGSSRELLHTLQNEMLTASEKMDYETAAQLRDQIKAIQETLERQSVVLAPQTDLDLLGTAEYPGGLALGLLFVRDGLLLGGRNFFWPGLTVEDTPELLYSFISQFYLTEKTPIPPAVIVPWLPHGDKKTRERKKHFHNSSETFAAHACHEDLSAWQELFTDLQSTLQEKCNGNVVLRQAKNVDEDRLVLLGASNAREAAETHDRSALSLDKRLADKFQQTHPIQRIEMVDISHTSGKQTKAGLVVFHNGEPLKSEYRIYNLDEELAQENVQAGDDYAALQLWAKRRCASGPPWPDLLLIDGGKGQLTAVQKIFSQKQETQGLLIASIAKSRNENNKPDRRAGNVHDHIFLDGRRNPLNLAPASPELLFLQRVRDTAHDFVIGKHRQARAAATIAGELTRLPGIGPNLAKKLFERFESLKNLARASQEELQTVPGIGKIKAALLHERIRQLVKAQKTLP